MCIAKHNCNSHYLCVKQIVHFLLDKSGRSSSRLYNVVCSPDVWRRVLWGIEELGWDGIDYRVLVAKVEDFFRNDFESAVQVRMLMFFAKKGDFLNMMNEVLREIASRHTFCKGKDIVKVKVTNPMLVLKRQNIVQIVKPIHIKQQIAEIKTKTETIIVVKLLVQLVTLVSTSWSMTMLTLIKKKKNL